MYNCPKRLVWQSIIINTSITIGTSEINTIDANHMQTQFKALAASGVVAARGRFLDIY
jgi:hypothetical protein